MSHCFWLTALFSFFTPSGIWPCSLPSNKTLQVWEGQRSLIKCSLGWKPPKKIQLCLQSMQSQEPSWVFVLALRRWYDSCWQLQVVAYTEYILQLSGNNIAPTKSQCCVILVIQVGKCQNKLKSPSGLQTSSWWLVKLLLFIPHVQ